MIDMTAWMPAFLQALENTFPERIWFVGLQGSYSRAEATETSDIDIVVVLDELTAQDVQIYGAMLDTLPHRELICGFLSGKQEILNWDAADLFQFYHDTTPVCGNLDELLARIDNVAVDRAIKLGVCNIYHGCVHNMLYEKSEEMVKALYKAASFVVQAICFRQTGRYIRKQKDLLTMVGEAEREIVTTFMELKKNGNVDFLKMSDGLFNWAKNWIEKIPG